MTDRPRLKRAPHPRPRLSSNLHLSKAAQIATVRHDDDDLEEPVRAAPGRYGSDGDDYEPVEIALLRVERD